jgi:hypothetical protein
MLTHARVPSAKARACSKRSLSICRLQANHQSFAKPVWLECSLYQCFAAGDHQIALLRIEGLKIEPHVSPLVFHASQFKQLSGS